MRADAIKLESRSTQKEEEFYMLWFNLMLTNHFPKHLSVGLITAVYKSKATRVT